MIKYKKLERRRNMNELNEIMITEIFKNPLFLIFLCIGLAYIIYKIIKNEKTKTNIEMNNKECLYIRKSFMTENEKIFYFKLKNIETLGYKVVPQVNLASIITKQSDSRYNTELFRNIDFGIFDNEYNLLLLIELNDSSHKQATRHERDLKVKKICESAKINLIFFYTSYPNERDYIINRVMKELEKE